MLLEACPAIFMLLMEAVPQVPWKGTAILNSCPPMSLTILSRICIKASWWFKCCPYIKNCLKRGTGSQAITLKSRVYSYSFDISAMNIMSTLRGNETAPSLNWHEALSFSHFNLDVPSLHEIIPPPIQKVLASEVLRDATCIAAS